MYIHIYNNIVLVYWPISDVLYVKILIVKKSSHIEISDSKFVVQSLVFKI